MWVKFLFFVLEKVWRLNSREILEGVLDVDYVYRVICYCIEIKWIEVMGRVYKVFVIFKCVLI